MNPERSDCGSAAVSSAADRARRPFAGSPMESRNPHAVRAVAAIVWLAFIVFPLANAIGKKGTPLEEVLVIAGATVFVAAYVVLVLQWRNHPRTPMPLLLFGVMLAVSAALTIWQASGWGFLFTYCAACAALVTAGGFWGVVACAVLAGVCSAVGGADGGTVIGFVASSAGVGMLMLVMRDLRVRNMELNEARAELASNAVAEERERFARDLHDLLGHSLSVIALKAELAGRLLADGPVEAANEVAELEQVARTALGEVRDAVSGYHQPTLDGELAGARMALSAAGIAAEVEESRVVLDPAVEAILAWAVREGATNVIRHSGARHCSFKITASLTDAGVEVIDDGLGGGGGGGGGVGVGGGPGRGGSGAFAGAGGGGGGLGHGVGGASHGVGGASHRVAGVGNGVAGVGNGVGSAYGGAGNGAGGGGGTAGNGVVRAGSGVGGHGLAGLAERARPLNGTVVAGALDGGGFRLAVTVPVPARRA